MLLAQLIIIAAIVVVGLRFLRSSGERMQATRRILLVLLGVFAVLSVLIPEIWTDVAQFLGIGRGTDLLLYGLTIAFLSYVATSYRRERALQASVTRLARRLALDEAVISARGEPHSASPGTTQNPGQAVPHHVPSAGTASAAEYSPRQ